MIFDNAVVPTALQLLEQSPDFTFYLGGSRRMAQKYDSVISDMALMPESKYRQRVPTNYCIKVSADTDYDFYTTYSSGVEAYLLNHGFDFSKSNEYYLDSECHMILCKDNVQVVLRRDAEFYRTVFENIDLQFYYNTLWKSSPANPDRSQIGNIFNMLFNIAHVARGE